MRLRLCKVGSNETVNLAVEELRRYLYLIDETINVDIFAYEEYREGSDGIWVMWDSAFAPEVEDVTMDDAFRISIKDNNGFIAGTTPISVLIGAYSLLKKLGCSWVRMGRHGELIDKHILSPLNFDYEEKADYRFRGVACTSIVEHLRDLIEWIPKEGMNNIYFEHMEPHKNFKGRYPGLDDADYMAALKGELEALRIRGIKRHAVGHGWHMKAIDFHDLSKLSGVSLDELDEKQISCLAEIDGKRGLYRDDGMISGTQLCYSQKHLRDRMASDVAEYLKENPDVAYLHFWLADGLNNHCECEECKKHRPSDWYVMMLNEIDKKLCEEGITARIVCLIYVDLLWEPVEFTIENPDRFILMFAPITRTYDTSYADFDKPAQKLPYVRNKLVWPRTAAENIVYLRDWQEKQLKGDSFVFDYHLMWNQYKAPGYRNLSRVIYEDMMNLENLGLGGNISCEIPTSQIPHDFPHIIMARTLWNKNLDYEKEEKQFFADAYGEDYQLALDHLDKVTKAFSVIYDYYKDKDACMDDQKALASRVEKLVADVKPVIEKNLAKNLPSPQRISWELLECHCDFILTYARAYCAKYQNDSENGDKYLEQFNAVCDRIGERYPNFISFKMAKFSVKYYYDEITDNGPNVVLI